MTNTGTATGTAQSKTSPNSERGNVTPEQIQFRAYEIYMARGSASGSDVEDWLQAERELLKQNPEQPQDSQRNQNSQQNPNPQQNPNQQNPNQQNPQQNQGPRPSSSSTNKPVTR
jgi:sugar (pentulose or hexulose) kinase